jgi:hypothetical protein
MIIFFSCYSMQAALNTNKYQLAKMLIGKTKDKTGLRKTFGCGENLAHVLVKTCKSDGNEKLITQVGNSYFQR